MIYADADSVAPWVLRRCVVKNPWKLGVIGEAVATTVGAPTGVRIVVGQYNQ